MRNVPVQSTKQSLTYKGDYIYDLDSAVKSVIVDFGAERTKFVTAVHLQRSSYDGRFSQTNKVWAATLAIPHIDEFKYICISSHATVLDGFIDHLRELIESRGKKKWRELHNQKHGRRDRTHGGDYNPC